MIVFWAVVAAMLAAVGMLLLPPLLRVNVGGTAIEPGRLNVRVARDQARELDRELAAGTLDVEQHAAAMRELEERVLGDVAADRARTLAPARSERPTAIVVAMLVPVLSLGLYVWLGAPASVEPGAVSSAAGEGGHAVSAQRIVALVEGLGARLKANPEDGEGWAMLARSYGVLGRHQDALLAYQNAVKRIDGNAQLLTDYADTLALLRGRKLAGEPHELVKRALALEPNNVKALALAGTAELEAGNAAAAIAHWEKVLARVPADAPFARSIAGSIAAARQSQTGASAQGPAAAQPRVITGVVRLGPALADKVAPDDTVFVFARAATGPRMPLAILKRRAADLPFEFKLDDSLAMAGGPKLSASGPLIVGVRVSRSGNAAPVSGDLEGHVGPLAPNVGGALQLTIDRVVP